ANRLAIDKRVHDGLHLNFRPYDQTGEAKATYGCPEPVRIFLGRANQTAAIAASEFEPQYVVPKSAGAMVVFPMYVVANRAAQADVSRAGRDRQEPSPRDAHALDLVERGPSFGYKA